MSRPVPSDLWTRLRRAWLDAGAAPAELRPGAEGGLKVPGRRVPLPSMVGAGLH